VNVAISGVGDQPGGDDPNRQREEPIARSATRPRSRLVRLLRTPLKPVPMSAVGLILARHRALLALALVLNAILVSHISSWLAWVAGTVRSTSWRRSTSVARPLVVGAVPTVVVLTAIARAGFRQSWRIADYEHE
jgi:hypothetical protein